MRLVDLSGPLEASGAEHRSHFRGCGCGWRSLDRALNSETRCGGTRLNAGGPSAHSGQGTLGSSRTSLLAAVHVWPLPNITPLCPRGAERAAAASRGRLCLLPDRQGFRDGLDYHPYIAPEFQMSTREMTSARLPVLWLHNEGNVCSAACRRVRCCHAAFAGRSCPFASRVPTGYKWLRNSVVSSEAFPARRSRNAACSGGLRATKRHPWWACPQIAFIELAISHTPLSICAFEPPSHLTAARPTVTLRVLVGPSIVRCKRHGQSSAAGSSGGAPAAFKRPTRGVQHRTR